jgi:hypothetical protein
MGDVVKKSYNLFLFPKNPPLEAHCFKEKYHFSHNEKTYCKPNPCVL